MIAKVGNFSLTRCLILKAGHVARCSNTNKGGFIQIAELLVNMKAVESLSSVTV